MWCHLYGNLENRTNEQTKWNRNRLIVTENKLMVVAAGGGGGDGVTRRKVRGVKIVATLLFFNWLKTDRHYISCRGPLWDHMNSFLFFCLSEPVSFLCIRPRWVAPALKQYDCFFEILFILWQNRSERTQAGGSGRGRGRSRLLTEQGADGGSIRASRDHELSRRQTLNWLSHPGISL